MASIKAYLLFSLLISFVLVIESQTVLHQNPVPRTRNRGKIPRHRARNRGNRVKPTPRVLPQIIEVPVFRETEPTPRVFPQIIEIPVFRETIFDKAAKLANGIFGFRRLVEV